MKAMKSVKVMPSKMQSIPASPKPATTVTKNSDMLGVHQVGNEVVFTTLCSEANSIQIAGDFNSWQGQRNQMHKISNEGVWQLRTRLTSGTYCYRLIVDGKWQQDPFNNNAESNPFGELNSVITVK